MSKLDTSTWKDYYWDELFEELPIKRKLKKDAFIEGGKVPVYSSDTSNYGICGYTDVADYKIDTPHLIFGDHTRQFSIVTSDFCVMDNVKILRPKYNCDIDTLLFIIAVWSKGIADYGYARHWKYAKECTIKLPVTEVEEPDYEYMEKYIAQLEAQRLQELEAYLSITGLDDYNLTEEDLEVLRMGMKEPK